MRAALLAFVLLAAPNAVAQSPPGESFDFKGVALGITLDEMRALRPADARAASARVICSGDPEVGAIGYAQIHVSREEQAAGVRRCAYYGPSYPGSSFVDIVGLNMGGGDYAAYDYQFDFFPDASSGEPRLYRIVLTTNVGATRDVLPALRDRFGPPSDTRSEPVQNRMGAQFDRVITRWQRSDASLTVVAPSGRLDRMSVAYRLTDLANRADAAVDGQRASAPNRM